MGTNKAEELVKKYFKEGEGEPFYIERRSAFEDGYNYRQSEIDELTKEVERLRKERHILLLDFYKGLKNIGRLYSDNTSEEIMMNDVSEFLTTH